MLSMMALACSTMFVACSSDDSDPATPTPSSNIPAVQALTKQYLEKVVYPTYTSLGDKTADLFQALYEAKVAFRKGTLTQADIDAVCSTFKGARSYWEASEAFLYGPATTFGIDPHIDTWPLDVEGLATELSNAEKVAQLDGGDDDSMLAAIAYAGNKMGQELLGFHGIEFILFRDGNNRTIEALKGLESDEAFAGTEVTGEEELVYATAVAGDLMLKCWQLQVAWMGEAAGAERVEYVEELWELETQMTDNYYGDNMLSAGNAGSTFKTWPGVLNTILYSGCANICNEVASTKIGNAWSGNDVSYIESPYSKMSFVDFYDNIMSIKNTLYGGVNLTTPADASIIKLLQTLNATMAQSLITKTDAALAALQVCRNGQPFVDIINSGQRPQSVQDAINAINALNDELIACANWAATIE